MKKIFFLLLFASICIVSCQKEDYPDTVTGYYRCMHFERDGAGSLHFDLFETVNQGKLKAHISYYNFSNTSKDVILEQNTETVDLFNTFYAALHNENELAGDYTPSVLPTGTWANITFELNSGNVEVTNTELRDGLLQFEALVKKEAELN
ncbi:hypothetical protein ACE01N_05130 [Saccharicrinis sp. FJH2]|uniref:hypothetical protein n=1 Tax=Saccharicrinis sp. FJH65 TaxID=3344659 RepID=UPI0035F3F40E